ncbi:MAG: ABC transporter substrate-binding protein [Dissulfurispiraceae bacterium]
MQFRGGIVSFLLIGTLFLASCSSVNRLPGYVYFRLSSNPTTLDPALITDVSSATIAAKIFNGLVRLKDGFEIGPDICERWELSKDGLVYKFFLRRGVNFSGGREVNAWDVSYSFQRILDPNVKSPNAWIFEKVEGANEFRAGHAAEVKGFKVLDTFTFAIRLKRPFTPFLSMLTMTQAYIVPKEKVELWGVDFSSHPSGTGPFILKEWLPNREVRLDRRGDYFDATAHVSGIIYKILPEDLTAITEFELGNIDVMSLPASAYSKFRKSRKWGGQIVSIQGLNTYYLGMNSSRPPFDNVLMRRAVSYAIDRRRILETFYESRGRLASGPVPDVIRKWDLKEKGNDPPEFNPALARKILDALGMEGIKVTMYVTAEQEIVDLAEIIQSYLSEVGIKVVIKQLEWSAFKEVVNKGEPDMFWLSWWADYPDPENFLFPLFHSLNLGSGGNRARYSSSEVDRLIEEGQYATDVRDRNYYYQQAEEIIVRDAPCVFFWHRTDYLVKQPWIKGYKAYSIYTMDKGTSIWL